MSSKAKKSAGAAPPQRKSSSRPSKKDQIVSLFHSGYFDLYTSTSQPQNVYSKFFAGKLGFKDVETAAESVSLIDRLYRQFEFAGDRAGQHHALTMALTMFDRARWTGKGREAEVFLNWLTARLGEAALDLEEASGENLDEETDEGAGEPETLP